MKIKITPEFLADLKAKAEKATPGPWNVDSLGNIFRTPHAKDEGYQPVVLLTKSSLDEYAPTEADAAYIAAASPQVVLAMIARMIQLDDERFSLSGLSRQLQADIDRLKVELHELDSRAAEMQKEYQAKITTLEKEVDWLARNRKCRRSSQYRGMLGVCPASSPKTLEDGSDIKPCGVFGRPFYTQDECAALWRKVVEEAIDIEAKENNSHISGERQDDSGSN